MIGKILGAIAGSQVAEHTSSVSGPMGAVLGAGSVALLKRLSIPALIAITAGGYAFKKWQDGQAKRKDFETPPRPSAA